MNYAALKYNNFRRNFHNEIHLHSRSNCSFPGESLRLGLSGVKSRSIFRKRKFKFGRFTSAIRIANNKCKKKKRYFPHILTVSSTKKCHRSKPFRCDMQTEKIVSNLHYFNMRNQRHENHG